MVSWRTLKFKVLKAWVTVAVIAAAGGAVMIVAAAFSSAFAPLALLGMAHLGLGGYALWQFARAGFSENVDPHDRQALARAETAVLVIGAAYAMLGLGLGMFSGEPRTISVVGEPQEVRSASRKVIMPNGKVYTYVCWKDEGRRTGTCASEKRWDQLPRWPTPQKVEMEVRGSRIRNLVMDGLVVVEAREFALSDFIGRFLTLAVSAIALPLTIRGIVLRMRYLRDYQTLRC